MRGARTRRERDPTHEGEPGWTEAAQDCLSRIKCSGHDQDEGRGALSLFTISTPARTPAGEEWWSL